MQRTIFTNEVQAGNILTPAFINNLSRQVLQNINVDNTLNKRMSNNGITLGSNQQSNNSGSFEIKKVDVLPELPTSGFLYVFWCNADTMQDGTGDNQIWCCHYPQTEFYPMQIYTSLSGEPV